MAAARSGKAVNVKKGQFLAPGDMINVVEKAREAARQGLMKMRALHDLGNLQAGEKLLDIDFRPADGKMYGLGSSSRIYTIDRATGG